MPARTADPARHIHSREDEAIYVTSGVLTVAVGDQRHQVGPGSLVWLPRGLPHTFANLSDEPVWTVGVITPSGLEEMFAEIAASSVAQADSAARRRPGAGDCRLGAVHTG
jgi:quercetin dioxygenase-like cupin family protein